MKSKPLVIGTLCALLWVQQTGAWAQHAYPTEGHSLKVTVQAVKEVAQSVGSGFAPYDQTPLAQRMPLVLVHGIGGNDGPLFHWDNFLRYVSSRPDFQAKYKIYLYHYDSTRSVPAISADLQRTLTHFVESLGNQSRIKILAYSEGGLLVRNAMQDDYLDSHTDEVLTIATPFHGSPLANPEWMEEQARTESAFSPVRLGQKIAYQITGRMYPTFRQDFHWDNFDGAIPMEQYVKNNGPIVKKDYALAKKANFVTYGSYFGTEVDTSVIPQELDLKSPPPKERLCPGNLFRKNFLFSLIRNNIGKLPLANRHAQPVPSSQPAPVLVGAVESVNDEQVSSSSVAHEDTMMLALAQPAQDIIAPEATTAPEMTTQNGAAPEVVHPVVESVVTPELTGQVQLAAVSTKIQPAVLSFSERQQAKTVPLTPVSMMMFNDGISPISSTLWLGRYTRSNGAAIPVERLWSALKALKGTGHARLFAGLDHRNWLDGNTRNGKEVIRDLLNPNEPPRTVFAWIVYDLMS